ncbi:MAG: ferrous iron transport protein A [Melioribacteraceae bacterium]|nr:ferrous iron transport protein A [Melioribacteraceae bacterium]
MLTRLCYCKAGLEVKIAKFCGGRGALNNIKSLNLSIDDSIIIQKNENYRSPVTIQSKGENILVGKELAAKIIVESETINDILLSSLRTGDLAEVKNVLAKGEIRRRLLDMGLIKGAILEVIRKAPLGDPIVVKLNGFDLSLRLNEAENIYVSLKSLSNSSSKSIFNKLKMLRK